MALDSITVYKSRSHFKAKNIDWGTQSSSAEQPNACPACRYYTRHLAVSSLTLGSSAESMNP